MQLCQLIFLELPAASLVHHHESKSWEPIQLSQLHLLIRVLSLIAPTWRVSVDYCLGVERRLGVLTREVPSQHSHLDVILTLECGKHKSTTWPVAHTCTCSSSLYQGVEETSRAVTAVPRTSCPPGHIQTLLTMPESCLHRKMTTNNRLPLEQDTRDIFRRSAGWTRVGQEREESNSCAPKPALCPGAIPPPPAPTFSTQLCPHAALCSMFLLVAFCPKLDHHHLKFLLGMRKSSGTECARFPSLWQFSAFMV